MNHSIEPDHLSAVFDPREPHARFRYMFDDSADALDCLRKFITKETNLKLDYELQEMVDVVQNAQLGIVFAIETIWSLLSEEQQRAAMMMAHMLAKRDGRRQTR